MTKENSNSLYKILQGSFIVNKFMNKTLYIIILIIVSVSFSACFAAPKEPEREKYLIPSPTEEISEYDTTIKMALVTDDFVMESWPMMDELYALSGMKAYYKTVRPTDWQDIIGRIMVASEGYDFVELDSYMAYVYQNDLVDISEYVQEYAPNYLEWAMNDYTFASNYAYGQPITYFPFREDTNIFLGCAFADPSMRGETIMDIEEFTIFMEGKQLSFDGSTSELIELIAPYFATSTYWYNGSDNQMVYGPTSDEFKLMLKVLNNFYQLGIIPKDFEYNPPTELTESVNTNTAGIVLATEDNFEWLYEQGYKPVMLNFSTNAYIPVYPSQPSKMGGIIAGTGNEVNVLKFIDACFSDEGRALLNYGVDGIHTIAHEDGSIEYLDPYTMSGDYQWQEQGLTPEGLPGIYYNSWARFDEELLENLIVMRQYLPDDNFLIPTTMIAYTSFQPRQIVHDSVQNVQYEWWTAFIKGEKSLDWDWGEYLSEMNNAGCTQGYLDSSFN